MDELTIGPESIKGTLAGTPKRAFATVRVNDPGLVKELDESDTKVSFADVAGIDEAREELEEVVEFLKTPEKF